MAKGGEIEDIAYLLDRGVRVALIYGMSNRTVHYPQLTTILR